MLVVPYCNSVRAFAAVSNEKSPILGAKEAKTSFLAFLSFFVVRVRALYVLATEVAEVFAKQLDTSRVLLHNVTSTRKAVGVLFETQFV